jgi:hypothetical protein
MWHWLAAIDGFGARRALPIHAIVGPIDQRIVALRAMRLIGESLDGTGPERD